MNSRTFKVIVVLVISLFVNIEAANAGLTHKLNQYIKQELNNPQWVFLLFSLVALACLTYVVAAPVAIGKQKWAWLNYYSYNPNRNSYQTKRIMVKKISAILSQEFKKGL